MQFAGQPLPLFHHSQRARLLVKLCIADRNRGLNYKRLQPIRCVFPVCRNFTFQ